MNTEILPPRFVHPKFRELLQRTTRPVLAGISVEEARAQIAARTAARAKGPEIELIKDFSSPGPNGDISMRMYRPKDARGIAIAFHGGGWMMGNCDSFDATARHLANESGVAVISVDYRLAPEHPFPAPLDDAWAATQWVARNRKQLGVEEGQLAVLGESAGGNLAAVVCLLARDAGTPTVALQILVYPAVDARLNSASLDEFADGYLQTKRDVIYAFETYGLGRTVTADDWRISPLLADNHRGLPKTLIISAQDDGTRDDSVNYTRRLLEAGVDVTHVCYAHMLHTFFGMRESIFEAEVAQRQVATIMRATLR
jgi:acetyl esterase